jgi:hypothetical protein
MVERSVSGMNVLVINCGSSSIKYGVYEMPARRLVGKGIVDRIGQKPSWLKYEHGDRKETREVEIEDHRHGVHLILDSILDGKGGPAAGDETIDAVGHRVVHGGTFESEAAFIDGEIMGVIEKFAPMAPLHWRSSVTGCASTSAPTSRSSANCTPSSSPEASERTRPRSAGKPVPICATSASRSTRARTRWPARKGTSQAARAGQKSSSSRQMRDLPSPPTPINS